MQERQLTQVRDEDVTGVIVVVYLSGWPLTSMALAVASRRLQSRLGAGQLTLGVLAGGIWPLLVLGAIQFGVIVAVSKAMTGGVWAGIATEPWGPTHVGGAVASSVSSTSCDFSV